MARAGVLAVLVAACGGATPHETAAAFVPAADVVIEGSFERGRSPDGNTIVLDAPRGLIVVDTGRHPAHQDKLLAHARKAGKPIAAIVNTHWHLDHTGGNAELRAAYPDLEIVATNAVEGALVGFFPQSRADSESFLASGHADAAQTAEIRGDVAAIDNPASLRPTRPVTASGPVEIAGRTLDVHVAPFAATEADLWLYDAATRTVISGDLVVAEVPFLDTACPDGWRKALGEIAAMPFDRLVPGHGAPMTRAAFSAWRAAFDALLDCAAGSGETATCIAGWHRDAAQFIPAGDDERVDALLGYYLTERLRSAPARARFCRPLGAAVR